MNLNALVSSLRYYSLRSGRGIHSKNYSSVPNSFAKMFTTKILPVKRECIEFRADELLPRFTDAETKENLKIAAKELVETNNVIGFPTETVYGLGGSALKDESVRSIYKAKNRPADNPLIVHVSSIDQLKRKILPQGYEVPKQYQQLIHKFWPGPLTILLPVHEGSPISKLVTANQDTFAVRIPQNPVARALIAISDTPLAAPSANASTRPSPTLASHVFNDLEGKIPYIIDGGACDIGVESTVIDGLSDPPMLLRPGGVSVEEIKHFGGEYWLSVAVATRAANSNDPVKTPGMKYKHYAPNAKVVLFVNCGNGVAAITNYIKENECSDKRIALLTSRHFDSKREYPSCIIIKTDLGTTGSEISRNLFKQLREVDEKNVDLIFVEGTDEKNEGLAIMNRLSKAAVETVTSP